MHSFSYDELLRLYAKLNAQDILITACLSALAAVSDDPSGTLESMRSATIDLADRQQIRSDDLNPEFSRNGAVLTLQLVANTFDSVKKSIERGV